MNSAKFCKLNFHRNKIVERIVEHHDHDLLLNSKDFPHLKKGDIVEIYHPEEEFSRLLLQVTTINKDTQGKTDVVSVEQSIAQTFQLRLYHDVVVNKVEYRSVILDSVEVTFKDQYLGRSEMWRLKVHLVNTCVYLNKKIEFCESTTRVQVYEMWSQGEKVTCGVIGESTKLVFRSSTSMVYLFIQMSSEMWEFDVHGDLYFEKAVNGFLSDLFQRWKTHSSNHEVTIVLFSRVYYKAISLDEFPEYMRECLQKDYKGHFYEDFYRVAVQNEKYEDWSHTLVLLQNLFSIYKKTVLECHKKAGYKVPGASLSTAVHGNFLEVLNIALNVFDKHYLERSLDRTGQLAVVVSPSVGVFEVDRELTNVTKQRIIDNGVGCDLVCLGEQPLHAVPLLKFYNKDATIKRDDYSMPHWINLSFYSPEKIVAYSRFVPRIKIPPRRTRISSSYSTTSSTQKSKLPTDIAQESILSGNNGIAGEVDYDAYDNDVFVLPSSHIASVQRLLNRTKKLSLNQDMKLTKWKLSDPDIYRSYLSSSYGAGGVPRSSSIDVADSPGNTLQRTRLEHSELDKSHHFEFPMDEEVISPQTTNSSIGSSACSVPPMSQGNSFQNTFAPIDNAPELRLGQALINPFDPSRITVKITSNRRRWTHVFPKGPAGVMIQQHHHHQHQPTNYSSEDISRSRKSSRVHDSDLGLNPEDDPNFVQFPNLDECRLKQKGSSFVGSPSSQTYQPSKKSQTLLWGATGEQQWTPALTTGIDWKSLTIPACLPITTDYFPDEVCLKLDYVFSDYNLLPEDVNADYARKRAIYRDPLTTEDVFKELVSQRLAQGFQLIEDGEPGSSQLQNLCMVGSRAAYKETVAKEYKLSIGRIFHKLSLCKSEIRITRYRPRHPYPLFALHYRYRFQAPDLTSYGTSWTSFNAEVLENFNWNYLDHYICTRGDTDFCLIESCKYWRFRVYALPSYQPGTKKILEDPSGTCDVYSRLTRDENYNLLEEFLRFIESIVNKIRRTAGLKPQPKSGNVHATSFRERFGSTSREKTVHRSRSGSKTLEKLKIAPIINDVSVPSASTTPENENESAENNHELVLLKENATNDDIIEMLLHPNHGVGFLSHFPSLPSNSFISYDAVRWFKRNVEGVSDDMKATERLEELRKLQYICHASGDHSHPFLFGSYLYFIPRKEDPKQGKDKSEYMEPIRDLVTFRNEWAEVETLGISSHISDEPIFLCEELPVTSPTAGSELWSIPMYKQTHLEVDVNNKSDRIEWGHARYQSVYNVEEAFELVIEWVAASGPIVSDLVYSYARKAQTYNLQLIPVPADPHALPYALKSDPLRGPVFVPLNTESLVDGEDVLFEEYPQESRAKRLSLLQEEIAVRFGFIRCRGNATTYRNHDQYVHLTGNIFLLIASPSYDYLSSDHDSCQPLRNKFSCSELNVCGQAAKSELSEIVSPHQEYISRHVTDMRNSDHMKADNRIGYLWSWNHMIGRRWKGSNQATNDEAFQDKLLLDFRQFCANNDDRLLNFWNCCRAAKSKNEAE